MSLRTWWNKLFKAGAKSEVKKSGQLFFIGNKRSGTTILAKTLNIHPNIHITHESDIIWILYNLYNGIEFEYYPKDEPHSTVVTLETCRNIMDHYKEMTPLGCYERCQHHLMAQGTKWMPSTEKKPLILGDKKPNQQSEPLVNDWLHKHFPNTRYVHIVRHPFDFLNSVPRLPKEFDLGLRYGSSKCEDPYKILEAWAYFEDLAIREKEKGRFPVHTVRFEDFCHSPAQNLKKIWRFTGLEIPEDLQRRIEENDRFGIREKGLHKDSMGNRFDLDIPENVRKIMDIYGYTP